MLEREEGERLRRCAAEQPLVRPWIEVCDDWLAMSDRRTWYEVSVVIGGLPPALRPVEMPMVRRFDSEAEATEWAGRFREFLGTQSRVGSAIIPTDEEVEFLGGDHCAVEFNGITERTERRLA